MIRRITILYSFAWILYGAFAVVAFPWWNISVAIPHFLLLGLGAWIYGTSRALVFMIPAIIFHMYLLSHLHADIFNWYQTKATSPLINILIIELAGNLKLQFERIRATNERLDQLVDQRNTDLSNLTDQLLKNSENTKIANGQKLHDGIGQQLTGVQLLSSTLSEQLLDENNPVTAISLHLKNQASLTHHRIRKISRQLFPVRIGHVGLLPALDELSSCLNDIKPIKVLVQENPELPSLSEYLQLQLFRICQETTLYLTDHQKATRLSIAITNECSKLVIAIEHNGINSAAFLDHGPFQLIRYRVKQINGTENHTSLSKEKQLTTFSIPLSPQTLLAA